MPRYDYTCTACDFTVIDAQFLIAERDYPTTQPCPKCKKEGTLERVIASPGVSYTINQGGLKTPETFKDMLRDIKKRNRGSTIQIPD